MKTRTPHDERTVAYSEELLASLRGTHPKGDKTRIDRRPHNAPAPRPALRAPQPVAQIVATEVDRLKTRAAARRPVLHARHLVTALAGLCALAALATALFIQPAVSDATPAVAPTPASSTTPQQPAAPPTTTAETQTAPAPVPDSAAHEPRTATQGPSAPTPRKAPERVAAKPSDAAQRLASGDHAGALVAYQALASAHPDEPVYAAIARVLAARGHDDCDAKGEVPCP